eukprot:s714_g10.t1
MDLRRLLEEQLTQVIYLDDRNGVVRTAQDAHTAIQAWQRYSLELSLRANMGKLRVITKDPSLRVPPSPARGSRGPGADVSRPVNITSSTTRALWQVLAGHQYDMRFFLRHPTVLSFLRAEWFWRRGTQLPPSLWTQQVNADFRALGFAKTSPWCWTHPEAGEVTPPRSLEAQSVAGFPPHEAS